MTTTHRAMDRAEMVSTSEMVPPHSARDEAKLAAIAADLDANGWTGRPLLGVRESETVMLLTGSHRYAAARDAGLDEIPVYVLDAADLGWTIAGEDIRDERGDRLTDDDTVLDALRRNGDKIALALMVEEVR